MTEEHDSFSEEENGGVLRRRGQSSGSGCADVIRGESRLVDDKGCVVEVEVSTASQFGDDKVNRCQEPYAELWLTY